MSAPAKKVKKKADPKYPPESDPEDFDPDEEESWPDAEKEKQMLLKKKKK